MDGMIATGAQIRAARAMLDWTRPQLAQASGLHKNAVRYWEQRADIPMDRFSVPFAVKQIEEALQREGVQLFVSREFRAGVGLVAKGQFRPRHARTRKREQPVETGAK
jgi:hypothetical protein